MISKLLSQLETKRYSHRVQIMVDLGRQIKNGQDSNAQNMISILEQGDFYQRHLALISCYGSHDKNHIFQATLDPSQFIRSKACKLASFICDDEQILTLLNQVSPSIRKKLLHGLSKRKRYSAIDAYLQQLAQNNHPDLIAYLSYGSPSFIEQHIDLLMDLGGVYLWIPIANRYPKETTTFLYNWIEQKTKFENQWLSKINIILPTLVQRNPETSFSLIKLISKYCSITNLPLQQIAERFPHQIVDLLLEIDEEIDTPLTSIAHKLDEGRLLALIHQHPLTLQKSSQWLQRLKPDLRDQVFHFYQYQWRDQHGLVDTGIITLLPKTLREQEARRHLSLPFVTSNESAMLKISYTEFLPWDEAVTIIKPYLNSPDETLRTHALSKLITTVRFHRDHLSEVLTILQGKRYEPDPIKESMFRSLSELPPSIWKSSHLDELDIILQSALDAKDLSHATSRNIQYLFVRFAPFHPKWAFDWIAQLLNDRGTTYLSGLDQRFTPSQITELKPIILPILKTWQKREHYAQLIDFARSIGKHLTVFDELVDLLVKGLYHPTSDWEISTSLQLLRDYRPDRFQVLIPKLLQKDPSWITKPIMYEYLHIKRQDLLTNYLKPKTFLGRFSSGKTYSVLPFHHGFQRWTKTQQTLYTHQLTQLIDDPKRELPTVRTAIRLLSAIPSTNSSILMKLANDPREMIRDWAIQALGRLDQGEGISTLLEALQDSRARVAIYALRRSLLNMPVQQAILKLLEVPTSKITVYKEVVRLLGDLKDELAFQELSKIAEKELHRDVRISLHHALWNYLEKEDSWKIYEQDAFSNDPYIARSITRMPISYMSFDHRVQFLSLLNQILRHSEVNVRISALNAYIFLANMNQVNDPNQEFLPSLLVCLQSTNSTEAKLAAKAIYHIYKESPSTTMEHVFTNILPKRHVLKTALDTLFEYTGRSWNRGVQRKELEEIARNVLHVLKVDPHTILFRLPLAIQILPWSELMEYLEQMVGEEQLTAEALMVAVHTLENITSIRNIKGIEELEQTLSSSSHEFLRRLGLATLISQAKQNSWQECYIERLKEYRQDPSILVAAAAQFIKTDV